MANISDIRKLCGPFIEDIRSCGATTGLLRGENESIGISKHIIRRDRRPLNTPEKFHKIADDYFYEKFNVRYRSAALFCTSRYYIANVYGKTVSLVFPIGNYTVCWSDSSKDLYCDIYIKCKGDPEKFSMLIDNAHYFQGNVCEAIKSGNEVMLHCDSYAYFSVPVAGETEANRRFQEIIDY